MKKIVYLLLFTFILFPCFAVAERQKNFSQAKKALFEIYKGHQKTFYCGCNYGYLGKKAVPDLKSCGYQVRSNQARAERIEWEHIMPAWVMGHQRQCWQNGGREECQKDRIFTKMEADLHNLVPAIGEVNGDRSNFSYGMIANEARSYGKCDIEIDFKNRIVEPSDNIKGDIARTYFYMRDTYKIRLSKFETKLLEIWNKQDPVDAWEIEKNKRITAIQGNRNAYIQKPQVFFSVFDTNKNSKLQCETKKYCSQMTSCREATNYLKQCNLTNLDKDGDGIACESLCK
jgi:deoxyribonuclease-1